MGHAVANIERPPKVRAQCHHSTRGYVCPTKCISYQIEHSCSIQSIKLNWHSSSVASWQRTLLHWRSDDGAPRTEWPLVLELLGPRAATTPHSAPWGCRAAVNAASHVASLCRTHSVSNMIAAGELAEKKCPTKPREVKPALYVTKRRSGSPTPT